MVGIAVEETLVEVSEEETTVTAVVDTEETAVEEETEEVTSNFLGSNPINAMMYC